MNKHVLKKELNNGDVVHSKLHNSEKKKNTEHPNSGLKERKKRRKTTPKKLNY
jgi:hypothetical protein